MRDYFYIVVPLPPYYILLFLLKIEILARPSSALHLKWGEMGQFLHGILESPCYLEVLHFKLLISPNI